MISSETLLLPATKVGKATDSFKVVSSYLNGAGFAAVLGVSRVVSSYLNGAGFAAILGVSCYHIFSFAYVDD